MKELVEHILVDQSQISEVNWGQMAGGVALAGALAMGQPSVADAGIMVDPGHGGKDPGAVYQQVEEEDITLAVSKLVASKLGDAKLTREDDSSVGLTTRAKMANDDASDAFVSIHVNSSEKTPTINGAEVWYYEGSVKGKEMATKVAKAIGAKRGIKPGKFAVLRKTNMPAILIELGFINHPEDRKKLIDPVWQENIATSIVNALKQ